MKVMAVLVLVAGTAAADPKGDVVKTIARQLEGLNTFHDAKAKAPTAASSTGFISLLMERNDDTRPADRFGELNLGDDGVVAKNIQVQLSKDKRTAVVMFQSPNVVRWSGGGWGEDMKYVLRASEMVIKPEVDSDWEVMSGLWSEGVKDAAINKIAQGPDYPEFKLMAANDMGPADLLGAMDALITKGFDLKNVHPGLVGIGSAPDEVIKGATLAKAWNKNWVGKLAVVAGKVTQKFGEDGDTGWGVAHVDLTKGTGAKAYKIHFRLYVVFEKDAVGAWRPWHVHVATRDF